MCVCMLRAYSGMPWAQIIKDSDHGWKKSGDWWREQRRKGEKKDVGGSHEGEIKEGRGWRNWETRLCHSSGSYLCTPRGHVYCRQVCMCVDRKSKDNCRRALKRSFQCRSVCPHPGVVTTATEQAGRRRRGGGLQSWTVEWLEQLLVKALSQPIRSVPFVFAETGEGVTQTCLHRTDCSLQCVCVCVCC